MVKGVVKGTISHYLKREAAKRLRNVPILGEVLLGHVEREAEDPDVEIAYGVREITRAEILGEKIRHVLTRISDEERGR
ncbi:TPA: hypothetical protein ENG04_00570 [Candidatus Poribacteria bacterium]|nr:hypothetical protein [Candidatus Poribacteria bacterium]HEX28558.1 hypothetical protein [Candidatus Poribacteria bacterium]